MSNKKIKSDYTANHTFFPKQNCMNNSRIRVEVKGSCLKPDKQLLLKEM